MNVLPQFKGTQLVYPKMKKVELEGTQLEWVYPKMNVLSEFEDSWEWLNLLHRFVILPTWVLRTLPIYIPIKLRRQTKADN